MTAGAAMLVDTDTENEQLPSMAAPAEAGASFVSTEQDGVAAPYVIRFQPGVKAPTRLRLEYAVWALPDVRLTKPMLISMEEDNGEIIVSNEDLNLWGTGRDKYKALADFAQTFVSVLKGYGEHPPEELTRDAVEYLSVLRSYVGR